MPIPAASFVRNILIIVTVFNSDVKTLTGKLLMNAYKLGTLIKAGPLITDQGSDIRDRDVDGFDGRRRWLVRIPI